jgi:hypothetical protein
MIVYKPIEVTAVNLISTNLFETAPALYPTGAPFAVDSYTAVAGLLGKIKIYKALQPDAGGHAPDVSPTYWVYSSSTYQIYNTYTTYGLGVRVIDPLTHKVYQSAAADNYARPFDPVANPAWLSLGKAAAYVAPPLWLANTAYVVGAIRADRVYYPNPFGGADNYDEDIYRCITAHTSGTFGPRAISNPNWEKAVDFPRPFVLGKTYGNGYRVIDTDSSLYQSLRDNNNSPFDNKKAWAEAGICNKWAAFDAETNSQSKSNTSMTFTIAPGVVDAVILLNAEADLVNVVVREGLGGAITFDKTSGVLGASVTDWWEYFHSDLFIDRRQILFSGLPLSINAHITVTLTGASVALGDCIFSRGREISLTGFGLQVGVRDFSVVTEDGFGGQKFNKKRNRKRMSSREWIPKEIFNRTFTLLSDLPATPCVWVAADIDYLNEALMLKAWYKDFTVEIPGSYELYTSLELEGLT